MIEAIVISSYVIPNPSGGLGINYTLTDSGWTVLIWKIGIVIFIAVAAIVIMKQQKMLKEAIYARLFESAASSFFV